MSLNPYQIPTVEINEPREIGSNRQRTHYVLNTPDRKKVHFLFVPAFEKKDRLLISSHAALSILDKASMRLTPTPIFRGHNWRIADTDILCMYDPLLDAYPGRQLQMAWFLETVIHQSSENISNALKVVGSNYSHIITTGSSAGGMPAIKYALEIGGHAVVMNAQLYLSRYTHHWNNLMRVLSSAGDRISCPSDIETLLSTGNYPKSITLYINELDDHHKNMHADPFLKAFKNDERISAVRFENPTEPTHNSFLPLGCEITTLLAEKFDYVSKVKF